MRTTRAADRIRTFILCVSLALLAWSFAAHADVDGLIAPAPARASEAVAAGGGADNLSRGLVGGLAKRYPGARIEISPSIRWTRGKPPERIESVALFEESARGEVRLRVEGQSFDAETESDQSASAEGLAAFSAFVPAWIANRRVFPGEKLDESAFAAQEVNVASGTYRELRGLIVPTKDTALSTLQSRQTILEGFALLSSAVEHIPDVRRGDAVRINVVANGLVLTVSGTAQEPAYLAGRIRVLTDRTKRELIGQLESGGIVEVHL